MIESDPTTAEYPSSSIRIKILRSVLGSTDENSYAYAEHEAYPFVMDGMHKLLRVVDKYLFKQYHYRNLAIQALEDGDTQEAIDILKQIGV